MTVEELRAKIKHLEGYNKTLGVIQVKVQEVIYRTEMDIRKVCVHEELKYCIGYEPIWNSDGNTQAHHCKYCEKCHTLFVIRAFRHGEKELSEPHAITDLKDNRYFNTKVYIDWAVMKDIL